MLKIMRILTIMLLGVFTLVNAQYKNFYFQKLTFDREMLNTTITAIYEDKEGFLWFGTNQGLKRFDGYKFLGFRNNPENVKSISDNRITAILEDSKKQLWIGTQNGLNVFSRKEYSFAQYVDSINISNASIFSIFEDSQQNLWVGTFNGINLFDRINNRFINFRQGTQNIIAEDYINCIYEKNSDTLWLGTQNGIYAFHTKNHTFSKMPIFNQHPEIYQKPVRDILKDKDGYIWITTQYNGVFCAINNSVIHYAPNNNSADLKANDIRTVFEDSDRNIWLGTDGNGAYIVDKKNRKFTALVNNRANTLKSALNDIVNIIEDKNGTRWFATSNGIFYIPPRQQFKKIPGLNEIADPLASFKISFIYPSGNTLWIGTDGNGLYKFDFRNGTYTSPKENAGFSSQKLLDLDIDKKGNFWIATWGGGIINFNPKTGNYLNLTPKEGKAHQLETPDVMAIAIDSDNNVWCATFGSGLAVYQPINGKFKHFKYISADTNTVASNYLTSLYIDSKNRLWIGSINGNFSLLQLINNSNYSENNSFVRIAPSKSNVAHSVFFEKTNKEILLGTSNGLMQISENHKTFNVSYAGLNKYSIYNILNDEHQNLWISTNEGIIKYDIKENTYTKMHLPYLTNSTFIKFSACKDDNGNFYFGDSHGIIAFHPDSFSNKADTNKVLFTDFLIYNESVITGSKNYSYLNNPLNETAKITVEYGHNMLAFEFSALQYKSTENVSYLFKLKGFDKNWNKTTDRKVTYTNLNPGSYTFMVKSTSNESIWGSQYSQIELEVLPPWYLTWWAIVIYCLLGLSILFIFIYVIVWRIRIKNQIKFEHYTLSKQIELDHLKLQFFTNISHEFRTPLTLIMGPIQTILAKNYDEWLTKQLNLMLRNTQRLLRLTNQILDISKLESGDIKLKVSKNNITDFIEDIASTFKPEANKKNIKYSIIIEIEKPYIYFDADKVEKILYNLLSNAFKYTPENGKVIISAITISTNENEMLKITVEDSGIGISDEHLPHIFDRFYQEQDTSPGTGIGLALVKSLVELYRGTIEVMSAEDLGTIFTVQLPANVNQFTDDEKTWQNSELLIIGSESQYTIKEPVSENVISENKQGLPLMLIVDDNADVRDHIKDIFNDTFNIEEADNGDNGLKKAIDLMPGIVISDVMMPVMDGLEFCQKLKTDERISHIPIILLTARASDDYKLKGYETGADSYITKPFNPEILKTRALHLVESRKALREQFTKNTIIKDLATTAPTRTDEVFLKKVDKAIEELISDQNLDPELLSKHLAISRATLYNKLKTLTSLSVIDVIKNARLKKASQMMRTNKFYTIKEIAFEIGYKSPEQFSKDFKSLFGESPSVYNNK